MVRFPNWTAPQSFIRAEACMLDSLDGQGHSLHQPRQPKTATPHAVPVWAQAQHAYSRSDTVTPLPSTLSSPSGSVLTVLLDAALLRQEQGSTALRPLWAEEAMHRAYSTIRLVDARNRRDDPAERNPIAVGVEAALANDLAAQFRTLASGWERAIVPCSQVLRDVVADLGALFGTASDVALATDIEALALPAYKRRALVLCAAELVTNALLHGFEGVSGGRIDVSLTVLGDAYAWLRVADDGRGFGVRRPSLRCGVAAGLAGLLEADLTYERKAGWTTARVAFPTGRS
jgi:hypothetical protein